MRHLLIILFAILGTLTGAEAQTFTQSLQSAAKGEGTVTIHQSKEIDALVNGAKSTDTNVRHNESEKPAAKHAETTKPAATHHPDSTKANEKATAKAPKSLPDSTVTAPQRLRKITGWRVQAFAGGNSRVDRQRAEQTGTVLHSLFPSESIYVHFLSPRWVCRIGNYPTYEEAHQRLGEVKNAGYGSATIVKTKISVPY